MMKKKRTLENVSKYALTKEGEVFYLIQKKLVLNDKLFQVLDDNFGQPYSVGDYLIWQNYQGVFEVYDKSGFFRGKREGYINYLNNYDQIYFFDKKKNTEAIFFEDGMDKYLDFEQNGYIFFDKYIIVKNKSELIASELNSTCSIWQYTLPKEYSWAPSSTSQETRPATIAQIVGVYKDTLWLVVICDDIMLLGLDLQTGRERYHITEPVKYPTTWSEEERKRKRPFGNGTQIDAQSGILFGGFNHYYGEVELEAAEPAYHLYDIQESTELHGLRMNQFGAWEGDNIYFWEGANNNRFGIFSRKEKAVIWSGQIEEAQNTMPAIRQLDFSDGKLYVLDHHFTLHIFEQEF
ncbi:MAG: hypothetical protein H6564_17895 [Lewinellaceae bacterium]|nr:hypothetical protein [Lewinellaceae bacterium]